MARKIESRFLLMLSRGRVGEKKPNNECGGESGMGVMSGGELMASSLPLPASKIHPQIVCRASGKLIIIFRLPSSYFMRGFSERNPRTTDGDFTPSGLVGRRSRPRSDRRPGQHPSRTAGRNCAGNKAWSQRGHSLPPSSFPLK